LTKAELWRRFSLVSWQGGCKANPQWQHHARRSHSELHARSSLVCLHGNRYWMKAEATF